MFRSRSHSIGAVVALALLVGLPAPGRAQRPRPLPQPPRTQPSAVPTGVAQAQALRSRAEAGAILDDIMRGLTQREMDVSLVGLRSFMVNDCLGIRTSAGRFGFRLASPNLRIENTGVVMTFRVNRIHMDALTVRVRPNPGNLANPCTFGERFGLGGSASDVVLEFRYDPVLDLRECRVSSMGPVRMRWSIGGLNLKPLQNDLDRVAKNMIEDALNTFTTGDLAIPTSVAPDYFSPGALAGMVAQLTLDAVDRHIGTRCSGK